jgi:hypothetical protein
MHTQKDICNIPGKMNLYWIPEVHATCEVYTDYFVSLEEFKYVLGVGQRFSKEHKAIAKIVDSSKAKGSFPQEIQDYLPEGFSILIADGIKFFITITSQSVLTKMSINKFLVHAGHSGISTLEVASIDDAVEWLKLNAKT